MSSPTSWWPISPPDEILTLGIDPGAANLGWAIIGGDAQPRLLASGVIQSPPRTSLGERLAKIDAGLRQILAEHPIADLALERQVFVRNVTTAASVFGVCGVVVLAAHRHGLTVAEYPPTQIKAAVTGSGNASKADVQHLLTAILGSDLPITSDHAADAAAAAICHIHNRDITRGLNRRIA